MANRDQESRWTSPTQLGSADLLGFRLRKLTKHVAASISTRTRMFDPRRSTVDLTQALASFPMFLATYFAIAWSIYIADAVPDGNAEIYSSRYLNLDITDGSFLNVLAGHVVELHLLPEYSGPWKQDN